MRDGGELHVIIRSTLLAELGRRQRPAAGYFDTESDREPTPTIHPTSSRCLCPSYMYGADYRGASSMSDGCPDLFILPLECVTCCNSAIHGPIVRLPRLSLHFTGQTRGLLRMSPEQRIHPRRPAHLEITCLVLGEKRELDYYFACTRSSLLPISTSPSQIPPFGPASVSPRQDSVPPATKLCCFSPPAAALGPARPQGAGDCNDQTPRPASTTARQVLRWRFRAPPGA